MTISRNFWQKALALIGLTILLSACAGGTKVTRVQDVSESANTPYEKVLVIALLSSYDGRRYLEKEVTLQLAELGTDAVASTTMMDTTTPVTRETFLAQVDKIGADGVLITQLVDVTTEMTVKDARPQATYNFRPTYYYNVWSVDLTEYVKRPGLEFANSLVMATQVFDVSNQEPVWGIESRFDIVQNIDQTWSYTVFIDQAKSITSHLKRDGLIAR
jgi:hypothetical protein